MARKLGSSTVSTSTNTPNLTKQCTSMISPDMVGPVDRKRYSWIYKFINDKMIMFCNGFDGKYPAAFENSASTLVCTLKRKPAVETP